jgi:hypothetical protein
MIRYGFAPAWATLAAGISLAACTGGGGGHATSQDLLGLSHMQDASGIRTRELLPEEKAVISHAVGLSVLNPNSAQFRWPQIADTEDGPTNYCGMVNAKSAYPAYSGWQAYIVEGSIVGGKDVGIVRKMCQKYGLDPDRTS